MNVNWNSSNLPGFDSQILAKRNSMIDRSHCSCSMSNHDLDYDGWYYFNYSFYMGMGQATNHTKKWTVVHIPTQTSFVIFEMWRAGIQGIDPHLYIVVIFDIQDIALTCPHMLHWNHRRNVSKRSGFRLFRSVQTQSHGGISIGIFRLP